MYGSLVLSKEELAKQQAVQLAAANTYGHLVVGVTVAEVEARALAELQATTDAASDGPGQVRAEDAVKALADNPASFTELLTAELAREAPRVSVLKALVTAAENPASGATEEQYSALVQLLSPPE